MYGCLLFRLFETLQSLFWSVFGLISLYVTNVEPGHEFTEFVGSTMFGTYNVISLVVLLNMLIAMMNNSYQHIAVSAITYPFYSFTTLICLVFLCKWFWSIALIFTFQDHADIEWKFARTKLWMSYFEEGGTLPSPFNIIPSPKSVYYLFGWIKTLLFKRTSIIRLETFESLGVRSFQRFALIWSHHSIASIFNACLYFGVITNLDCMFFLGIDQSLS